MLKIIENNVVIFTNLVYGGRGIILNDQFWNFNTKIVTLRRQLVNHLGLVILIREDFKKLSELSSFSRNNF